MKAVIFDFDGTIVDSLAAVIRVLEQIKGVKKPMSEAEVEKLENLSMWQVARAMKVPLWKVPAIVVRGRHLFHGHMENVRVHPGMTELIAMLHDKMPLFVLSTNRSKNIEKYLTMHGLDRYFTRIYGEANPLSKVRKMRELLSREGLDARDTLCVGDEIIDIKSAHKIGMPVAAVTWGFSSHEGLAAHKPESLSDTVASLRAALEQRLTQDAR